MRSLAEAPQGAFRIHGTPVAVRFHEAAHPGGPPRPSLSLAAQPARQFALGIRFTLELSELGTEVLCCTRRRVARDFRPALEGVNMKTLHSKNASSLDDRGLRCWKCGKSQFRVIYTRPARPSTVMRRRECRICKTRITTYERVAG